MRHAICMSARTSNSATSWTRGFAMDWHSPPLSSRVSPSESISERHPLMNPVMTDYGLARAGRTHLDQIPASRLATRLELLRNTLRPTPHVQLAMKGMDLFAKLEYVNPVGSIKDRAAYWILMRAAERGDICEETTVIESSSGNFAAALAAFTHLVGLRFIPVIDPNISGAYESFLRRMCPTVVKVEERDDTGGFLKTRLQKGKELCATIPNAYWTNQYENPDAMEAHYELTAGGVCARFDSLAFCFLNASTGGEDRRAA